MKTNFPIWLSLAVLILIISCRNKQNNTTDGSANLTDSLLSKTISFPRGLRILGIKQSHLYDSIMKRLRDQNKMISIIDATCMTCIIDQVNALDSVFNHAIFKEGTRMIFILNLKKTDSVYFALNLQPAIRATGLLFLDQNYDFEKTNGMLTSNRYLRTFMTNSDGRIVQYGDPLTDSTLILAYKSRLRE